MRALRFDAFTLDQSRHAILRDGLELELRSQSFDVLCYLVEHAGRLIPKQELFEAVWGGAARTDDSLVQCIKDIRQALGDSDHRIIRTVHGRGYAFVAPVSEVGAAPETSAGASVSDGRPKSAARHPRWQPLSIAAALLVAVLAGGAWLLWKAARPAPPLTMIASPSIVVLPVRATGNDTDHAVAALTDEIVTELWRAPRAFQLDIRSIHATTDLPAEPKTLGRKLKVRYIVRSSARREDDLIRLNVQLTEAETSRQIWAGTFDYKLNQAGAQSLAAARVGRTLVYELQQAEVQRPLPANPEAAHYTMIGRSLMDNERSPKTSAEALALFEKAINMEPRYFPALVQFARLTAGHILNGWVSRDEREARLVKAEDAIKLALSLEPTSAGAHFAHGGLLRVRGEYEQAVTAFRQALIHNPNYAHAYAEMGRTKIELGRAHETVALIERAITISPTDAALDFWCFWAGMAALYVGDNEAALEWLRRSHQANRAYDNTLRLMAVALARTGRDAEARAKVAEFMKLQPQFTVDGYWHRPREQNPVVAQQRAHIAATLRQLGVPEVKSQRASAP